MKLLGELTVESVSERREFKESKEFWMFNERLTGESCLSLESIYESMGLDYYGKFIEGNIVVDLSALTTLLGDGLLTRFAIC